MLPVAITSSTRLRSRSQVAADVSLGDEEDALADERALSRRVLK